MRIVDLHCYPNTEPWIKSQGPYVEALAKYWNRSWTAKTEEAVIEEFKQAGVEAVLVAFDIESVTGSPPCTNDYVARMRDDHSGVIRQAWGAVDPLKGEAAIEEAVPADVLAASLFVRFRSRQQHTFAEKVLSAMRLGFGGHIEAPKE